MAAVRRRALLLWCCGWMDVVHAWTPLVASPGSLPIAVQRHNGRLCYSNNHSHDDDDTTDPWLDREPPTEASSLDLFLRRSAPFLGLGVLGAVFLSTAVQWLVALTVWIGLAWTSRQLLQEEGDLPPPVATKPEKSSRLEERDAELVGFGVDLVCGVVAVATASLLVGDTKNDPLSWELVVTGLIVPLVAWLVVDGVQGMDRATALTADQRWMEWWDVRFRQSQRDANNKDDT